MDNAPDIVPIAVESVDSLARGAGAVAEDRSDRTPPSRPKRLIRVTGWLRSRFMRRWAWAILPVILITIFQADTHYYYGAIWLGYDQPDHFNNVVALINTGQMPPPTLPPHRCGETSTCEAQQPPLFYALMAIPTQFLMTNLKQDINTAGLNASKIVTFLLSMIWFWLILCAIQMIMARGAWLGKMLVACAAMLIAQVVLIDTMLTNDFAESTASLAAILVLYLIARTARKHKPQWWLLAAALVGLCIAFKYSGIQVLAVYVAVAGSIAAGYLIRRHFRLAIQIVFSAAIGAPLVIVPLITTVQHAVYEVGGVVNTRDVSLSPTYSGREVAFFTTFSTDVLSQPMWDLEPGTKPGVDSFWSIQYDTLFVDFFNRWLSPNEFNLPPDKVVVDRLMSHPLSVERYQKIILVANLAIPVAALMGIALLAFSFRAVFHPRRALRDGSLVIWFTSGATLGSFVVTIFQNANSWWFTQPRYALFTYVLLLITGAAWVQKLWPRHRGIIVPLMRTALWVWVAVFCAASYTLFWLSA